MAKRHKINVPKTAKIGAHKYQIIYPHKFQEANYWGLHDGARKMIYITDVDNSGEPRPFSVIYKTWWHEILHAIITSYAKGMVETLDNSDLELYIDQMAEGLTQLVLDNELPSEG